ncbi:MAG: class I tRNA ligase family protein, partial [Kiritimatiellae bacterium]|nr:class I tRNA ligase family protein [Kiritimatiellia bacterium]
SSWYWLRYIDPHNKEKFADFEKLKYWGSVDCYTGGTEHITRHVLYSFFWQNFLYEIGVVPTRDPFVRKMGSGLILDNTGKKMSKSSTNGISPMEVINTYGADAARLHVHFMGGYEDNSMWTLQGINGVSNFLKRVWNLQELIRDDEVSEKHIRLINRLIKSTEEDIEDFKLNTMIASFMSFVNTIMSDGYITKEELRVTLVLMNPMIPHITSEIYEKVFGNQILDAQWPKYDTQYLTDTTIEIPVQINGKKSMVVSVAKDISQEDLLKLLTEQYPDKVRGTPKKVIYVPNRIVNIIQ